MKKIVFGLLMLVSSIVAAQIPIEMPWSSTLTIAGTATPLRQGTSGLVAISGQSQKIDLRANPILATFPGQKSSAMVVAGVRLAIQSSGIGWTASTTVDVALQAITVPAGKPLSIRLDTPIQLAGVPIGTKGVLAWALDTSVVSGGTITPAPAPAPVPAPAPAPANVPGDSVPPLAQLTDSGGAVWTLAGTRVLRNGVDLNVAQLYSDVNQLLMSASNIVRAISPSHGYLCDPTGAPGAWTTSGC